MVLDVVITDDLQDDSSSMRVSCSNSHAVSDLSVVAGSSSEATSVARDVASLMIRGTADSQALVMSPQGRSLETAQLLRTDNNMAQSNNMHPFELQMEELVGRIQQTDQKVEEVLEKTQQNDQQREHAQQQIQDQIDRILQTLQQIDRQHTDKAERVTQQLNLYRQQWGESLQTSQQQQQQRFEAVQQKFQQLDQNIQDSRQQMQDIRQQVQDQIDKVLIDVQQLNQRARHFQQQHEKSLQHMHDMGKARHYQGLSPELGSQESQLAFHQFVNARYRVQAVLTNPSPNLPAPRLFIILPAPRAVVDGQGESCQLQFRLYFLCECGSYTMDKDCDKQHEVHMAIHPGYDLINQDEFINKYGSYLLTMMYMVKYGARTRRLVVPPLFGLAHVIGEHENIGQLVDDTILRLKEATGYLDGDSTEQQGLNATELTGLQSHLKVTDGGCFAGGLSQKLIQKGHYAWICSDHWRESYELALRQLKYNIIANGGVWKENVVKVNVTSEAMARTFYHDLGKLFRIQSVKNWRSLTEVDYGHDSHQSVSGPTTKVFDDFDGLKSLFLDFGRFTMSVKGISEVEVKDVAISIEGLSTLTLDELEFIQQCRSTALAISQTPQKKDDNRLVSLLQHNVTTLRIDCDMKRYIAVIDLVCSTREKMLQSGYRPALRTFELVHPEINVKICFDEGSPVLDTAPCVNLGDCRSHTIEPAVYNYIRQHGWSTVTFVVPESFSDRLAMMLDESMQGSGSRISRFDITPTSLTTPGLDAMSRVIKQSQGLTYLRLSLESLERKDQLEKALFLLGRHKDQLTSLRLGGRKVDVWLLRIAQTFPDKDGFPVLEEFFVEGRWGNMTSRIGRQWVASVVSIRQQPRTPLKVFGVTDYRVLEQNWETLILAIDFSTIEELHFNVLSFRQKHLELLVVRIVASGESLLPLRVLDLKDTVIADSDTTRGLLARVREKAPKVEIRWDHA